MSNCKNISELIINEFKNFTKIGFLGYGREGRSSLGLISKYLSTTNFIIADSNENLEVDKTRLENLNLKVYKGNSWTEIFNEAEIIFVSPGVPLFNIQIPENIIITSQTDFVLKHFGEKIIAVTGTKGKSTTSTLIAELLRSEFETVPLAGNIGLPAFEIIEEINNSDVSVLEVSSHQLQIVRSSPKFSVFLNIYPEHLDYYPDFETYFNAKKNIFLFQNENHFTFFNFDDNIISGEIESLNKISTKIYYSMNEHPKTGVFIRDNKIFYRDLDKNEFEILEKNTFKLKGDHNLLNSLPAIALAKMFNISNDKIQNVISRFKGLSHRLETIETSSSIEFINDSISTIPQTCLAAIDATKPVYSLILGGFDRGIEFSEFISQIFASDIKLISFYGPAGKRMYDDFLNLGESNKTIKWFSNFDDSVNFAIENTVANGKCLFSPAASSYDQFKNFEERGFRFIYLVSKFSFSK